MLHCFSYLQGQFVWKVTKGGYSLVKHESKYFKNSTGGCFTKLNIDLSWNVAECFLPSPLICNDKVPFVCLFPSSSLSLSPLSLSLSLSLSSPFSLSLLLSLSFSLSLSLCHHFNSLSLSLLHLSLSLSFFNKNLNLIN